MHLVIFESAEWKSLAPISISRPTFMLQCGVSTLLEKQIRFFKPTRLTLWVRPQLVDYCHRHVSPLTATSVGIKSVAINEPLNSAPATVVDGSALFLSDQKADIAEWVALGADSSRVVCASVISPGLSADDAMRRTARWMQLRKLPHVTATANVMHHVWDLLASNEDALLVDAAWLMQQSRTEQLTWNSDGPFHLINKEQVFVSEGAKIGVGSVLDATNGPIILGAGSIIGANAVIQGPCCIGANTEITPLALIRRGTSIGPRCKIGGEVSRSIVTGYSNKAHDGFLGDSYLGEWINLGAGTTTSNLKNTYGPIDMNFGSGEVETGRNMLGSIIGDHSKTAIGTRFMSGSYVGYSSMIATSAHAKRFTKSFTFLTDRGTVPYRLEKAIEVAQAMYARRNRTWTSEDESILRYAAAATEVETPP